MVEKLPSVQVPEDISDTELLLMGIFGKENNVVIADAVMVCNGYGNVLSVHDTYEHFFGVTKAYVVGKSVYDLEKEGIFSPSVTRMVIEQKKRIVTTQRNKKGTLILTTGILSLTQRVYCVMWYASTLWMSLNWKTSKRNTASSKPFWNTRTKK